MLRTNPESETRTCANGDCTNTFEYYEGSDQRYCSECGEWRQCSCSAAYEKKKGDTQEECRDCYEERRAQLKYDADLCSLHECPMMGESACPEGTCSFLDELRKHNARNAAIAHG